jgi:hypothetical protein
VIGDPGFVCVNNHDEVEAFFVDEIPDALDRFSRSHAGNIDTEQNHHIGAGAGHGLRNHLCHPVTSYSIPLRGTAIIRTILALLTSSVRGGSGESEPGYAEAALGSSQSALAEIGLVRFARPALEVSQAVLPSHCTKISKHLFTQPQLLAVL